MIYIIKCDCGTDIKGENEDETVTNGIEHAKADHSMTVTAEQVRPLVEVVAD